MPHRLPICRAERAFTLMELLVVITIIAVLTSLLLPTIGMVRESARTVTCSSNLRQIAVAGQLYADEHEGILAPLRLVNGGQTYWPCHLAEYLDAGPDGFSGLPEMWQIKRSSVFWSCRSFRPRAIIVSRFGYGMNTYLFRDSGVVDWTQSENGAYGTYCEQIALARITKPSQRALFCDSISPDVWTQVGGPFGFPAASGSNIVWGFAYDAGDPTRHGQKANYAYVDGHVGTVPAERAATLIIAPSTL